MLSNPTNLHQRQRQHRRQQSTPTAFDTLKVPNLPTIQRHGTHKRGISLDQRPRRHSPRQDLLATITNQGFQYEQQHILRETQQQRLARPGQHRPSSYLEDGYDENYLISSTTSPQRQSFDSGCESHTGPAPRPYSYSGAISATPRVNSEHVNTSGNHDPPFSLENASLTPTPYLDFGTPTDQNFCNGDWNATLKAGSHSSSGRRISGGIAQRVAQFENLVSEPLSRPTTPPSQDASSYFPLTPATTPYHRIRNSREVPRRFMASYDTSLEETLKPSSQKGVQRMKNTFDEMREHAESCQILSSQPPSPPGSASRPNSALFENVPMEYYTHLEDFQISTNVINTNLPNVHYNPAYTEYQSSYYSASSSNVSPEVSRHSSPDIAQSSLFEARFDDCSNTKSGRSHITSWHQPTGVPLSSSQGVSDSHYSPMRRSESVDSINVEETITDTGITIDDIAHYIEGPDAVDQKWMCLYPECNKRFGRKENIKSHVQTHLGDRQYQCPHCHKCFVRQHDLKRHAKIHSGVKPYPCACGNSFARHDALTRHRQRGMCIGAFDGIVKKVVKRGRPRKHRPDHEERLDKSSRQRSKNKASSSIASSASEYSESSYGQSPCDDFDVLDEKPFINAHDPFAQASMQPGPHAFDYSISHSGTGAVYVSPRMVHSAPSPPFSLHSQQSHYTSQAGYDQHRLSIASIPEHQMPAPSVKSEGLHGQYNTPPELCLSSSPAASNRVYQDASSPFSQHDNYSSPNMQALDLGEQDLRMSLSTANNEDDLFLDNFGVNTDMDLARLEQDPNMLFMGGKFDDAFAAIVDEDALKMFGDCNGGGSDVFFGSP